MDSMRRITRILKINPNKGVIYSRLFLQILKKNDKKNSLYIYLLPMHNTSSSKNISQHILK